MTNKKTKKITIKPSRIIQKKIQKKDKTVHTSLLLPRYMFNTDQAQLVVSLLMLTILIIQVYLFINVYKLLDEIAQLQAV